MGRGRNDYLNKSADIVCRAVYETCRRAKKENAQDVKQLKELCGVLKEAIGVSLSLEKTQGEQAGLLVTFDTAVLPYTE